MIVLCLINVYSTPAICQALYSILTKVSKVNKIPALRKLVPQSVCLPRQNVPGLIKISDSPNHIAGMQYLSLQGRVPKRAF